MALILVILYGCIIVGFSFFVGKGLRAASARRYLLEGARQAQAQNFSVAREAILVAVRQNPSLRVNTDVQALYELIVAGTKGQRDTIYEIRRIASVITKIPQNKSETFIEHPSFKAALILLFVVLILLKLLAK